MVHISKIKDQSNFYQLFLSCMFYRSRPEGFTNERVTLDEVDKAVDPWWKRFIEKQLFFIECATNSALSCLLRLRIQVGTQQISPLQRAQCN